MGWLTLMQKCGNVAIFWTLLASVDLRNGPEKNDSNNGNEHVGMQKGC